MGRTQLDWLPAVDADRAPSLEPCGVRGQVFLYRSCAPLTRPIRSTDADRGRLDLWPNECESSVASATRGAALSPHRVARRFDSALVQFGSRAPSARANRARPALPAQTSGAIDRARCCPHRRSQHQCSRRRMSGHAKFVRMVFVALAAAASSGSHLLLRRTFCAGDAGLQSASSGQSDLVASARDRTM